MQRSTPTHEEGHLADQLQVLRRRWRTVTATFLAFMLVTALINYRLPRIYQATARVVISAGYGKGLLSERGSPMEGYLLERRSFETQLEVIRSEPVARLAAEQLGWIDAGSSPAEVEQLAARVKSAVRVAHLRDTRIVLVSAQSQTPEGAQQLANAVAESYIRYAQEQGAEARIRSMAWLTGEIEQLRQKLRDSEERLVDYLSREQIDLSAEVVAEPASNGGAEHAQRQQLASAQAALSEMLGRYRERHPRVLEARAQLRALERRLASAQEHRAAEQRKLIQYRLLKRDADLDHQMYEVLLKKLKETDLSAGVSDADIRVLEAARRPGVPVSPQAVRNLLVAAVLGLSFALALAFAVEYFDRSITSAEDVSRALGLSTLGVVSRFPGAEAVVSATPRSAEAEMFRTLRSNVRFSHVDLPRRIVLVTSTGPAEGKSTILANLGASLAQSGRRTLLIDTDLRRPALHRIFGMSKTQGLADVLAGDAELDAVVRETEVPELELISCGTVPANPAELIESVRLQDLIAGLRERYDYVLLDSPPAGGLVDASLLSALADGVLFVVEPRRYDWRVLRGAVRQLERAGGRLYGVVINKAPRVDGAQLYDYYRYGRDQLEDEAQGAAAEVA